MYIQEPEKLNLNFILMLFDFNYYDVEMNDTDTGDQITYDKQRYNFMLRYIKEVLKLADNMKQKNKIELDEINDIYEFIDDVKNDLKIESSRTKRRQQKQYFFN